MVATGIFSETVLRFCKFDIPPSHIAEARLSAYLTLMANTLMPRGRLCALVLVCAGCSSDPASITSSPAGGGGAGVSAASAGAASSAHAGASPAAGGAGAGAPSGSTASPGGNAGTSNADQSSAAPPAVDGQSIYALACHGDSTDCNLGTVPCFGVGSQTPNVAAGWACANRCASNADCSDAPSGADARASCVSLTSASHCLLVCKNENQAYACPTGMICYTPPQSPIAYCLWQ